jgi:hypothetical protein
MAFTYFKENKRQSTLHPLVYSAAVLYVCVKIYGRDHSTVSGRVFWGGAVGGEISKQFEVSCLFADSGKEDCDFPSKNRTCVKYRNVLRV